VLYDDALTARADWPPRPGRTGPAWEGHRPRFPLLPGRPLASSTTT